MLTLMMSMNIMMSVIFVTLNHPISMGVILLIQTILISLITGNMNQNFWFSYILFLILIGGMLILFMYMTSIASNEKFKPNMKMMLMMMVLPLISWTMYPMTYSCMKNNETTMFSENSILAESLNKYINMPLSLTLVFLMIYLLLALIATVKITNFKQGSIRQMN